jgi:hypothetical protein
VRYIRMLGACPVMAAVVIATMTGSASAKLPEWGTCTASATHEGKYADPGCIQPVKKVYGKYTGSYEWYPLVEATSGNPGAELLYGGGREQSPVTITFKDGYQITCSGGLSEETYGFPLRTARSTTAPDFGFAGCVDSEGGGCTTSGGGNELEIESLPEWEKGEKKEPGSWKGEPKFISGKGGPTPVVGMVYQTEEPRGIFYGHIACEGEAVHAFTIGGEKRGEQLTSQITPVNTMTSEYTATLTQSGGVQGPETLEGHPTKPLYAEVNGNTRETIGIEGAMLFTSIIVESPNHKPPFEVELKATP